jgi:hypothetical protein
MKKEQINDLVQETIIKLELAFGGRSQFTVETTYQALLGRMNNSIYGATYNDFLLSVEMVKKDHIDFWEVDCCEDCLNVSYETDHSAKSRLVA